jgi:hypothetical protein
MPTAPETDSDHTRATVSVPADDAAGRLLAALLATGGLTEQPAEPALTESAP